MYRKIVLAALLVCANSQAENADLSKPIELESGPCHIEKNGVRRCSGGVTITQGSMVLKSDKTEMWQDADDNIFAKCEGKPVTFRQKLDSGEWIEAEALGMSYDGKKKILQLQGKAMARRGVEVVSAETLTYDMGNETFDSTGKGDGRTRIVIMPKKKAAQ